MQGQDSEQNFYNNDNIPKNLSGNDTIEIFPPSSSDVSQRTDIKPSQIISNLEVTRDLKFHHQYISEQIDKFTVTPILCNKCNDLSRHFLDPAFNTNELYVCNSKWVLNPDSKLTMVLDAYKGLTFPIYDIRNIKISHPSDRPIGKIHLRREASDIQKKSHFVRTLRSAKIARQDIYVRRN